MVGWHHQLNEHEFDQAPGVGDGQGSLACCSPWGCRVAILFLEEDEEVSPQVFDRMLQSLIHQRDFKEVKAVIIGRFQDATKMTRHLLEQIVGTKDELKDLTVIGNVDIGHTTPIITYPIGGKIEVDVSANTSKITILEH